MSIEIGNQYLDSRDIEEKMAELSQDIEDYMLDNDIECLNDDDFDKHPDIADTILELREWDELKQEAADAEWSYGQQFIHADAWVDYVIELCQDIGDVSRDLPHYIVIDWEATADNIAVDYYTVDIDGHTYYYRAC